MTEPRTLSPEDRTLLAQLERAHRMSASDPTKHTIYGDAAALIRRLIS